MSNREKAIENFKALLMKEKITDVKLGHNHVVLQFGTGHEMVIETNYDDLEDETYLDVSLLFIKKESIGGFSLWENQWKIQWLETYLLMNLE